MAAIVISSNTGHVWSIYLHMGSVKFVLEMPGTMTPTGALLFSGDATILWQIAEPFGGTSIR